MRILFLFALIFITPVLLEAQEVVGDTVISPLDPDSLLATLPGGEPSIRLRPFTDSDRWAGERHSLEIDFFRLYDYLNLGYQYTLSQYFTLGLRFHTTPDLLGGTDTSFDGRLLAAEFGFHPVGLLAAGGLRFSLGYQYFRGTSLQSDWENNDTIVSRWLKGESLYLTFGYVLPVIGQKLYSTFEIGVSHTLNEEVEKGGLRKDIPWISPLLDVDGDWSGTGFLRLGYRI